MARIKRVPAAEMGQDLATTLGYVRHAIGEMIGGEPDGAMEPLEVYAHAPGILRGMLAHQEAAAQENRVPTRIKHLAHLKAAALTNCEYCIDLGSLICRRSGFSDEELLALPFYKTSPLFTEVEKLVLHYAVGMSRTPVEVSNELFAKLREHFDEGQMVELTHTIAFENFAGRSNLALGIGSAGYSEGMVCAVPERVPEPASAG